MSNNWCESCARKGDCYAPNIRPKCYIPITNTEIICSKTMTGTHRERIEYAEAEMMVEDEPQMERSKI